MQNQTEDSIITSLACLWQVPLVRIVWMSNGPRALQLFLVFKFGRIGYLCLCRPKYFEEVAQGWYALLQGESLYKGEGRRI